MASRIQRDRSRSDGVRSLEHAFARVMMKITRVILEITPTGYVELEERICSIHGLLMTGGCE